MGNEKLTDGQRRFLENYFENVLHDDLDFETIEKAEFIKRVNKMDFDDGEPSTPGTIKIARSLHQKGMFDDFDVHEAHYGKYIYLSFSEKGAETMHELMTKAKLEGRLPQPQTSSPSF